MIPRGGLGGALRGGLGPAALGGGLDLSRANPLRVDTIVGVASSTNGAGDQSGSLSGAPAGTVSVRITLWGRGGVGGGPNGQGGGGAANVQTISSASLGDVVSYSFPAVNALDGGRAANATASLNGKLVASAESGGNYTGGGSGTGGTRENSIGQRIAPGGDGGVGGLGKDGAGPAAGKATGSGGGAGGLGPYLAGNSNAEPGGGGGGTSYPPRLYVEFFGDPL